MVLFNKRLAWAPLTISLIVSAALAAASLISKDIEVRGVLWFLIAAVLLVGAFRAAYWRYLPQRVIMRDGQLHASARALATELHVAGPDD